MPISFLNFVFRDRTPLERFHSCGCDTVCIHSVTVMVIHYLLSALDVAFIRKFVLVFFQIVNELIYDENSSRKQCVCCHCYIDNNLAEAINRYAAWT